jgi:acetolactate synthase-1/3 small subunit
MKGYLSVLVENHPGVLTHISGLISRRAYNIASISASATEEPDITRISLVVEVKNEEDLEQVKYQISKLVQVVKVLDMSKEPSISRELALIKVRADSDARPDIVNIADIFRARVVDVHPESIVIELTGDEGKINAFGLLVKSYVW